MVKKVPYAKYPSLNMCLHLRSTGTRTLDLIVKGRRLYPLGHQIYFWWDFFDDCLPLSKAHFLKTYIHIWYSSFLVSIFLLLPLLWPRKEKKVFIVQGTFSSSVVPPVPSTTPPFFLAVKEILYQHVWHFQRDFYFYAKWAVKCASSSESSGALLPCTMCTLLY